MTGFRSDARLAAEEAATKAAQQPKSPTKQSNLSGFFSMQAETPKVQTPGPVTQKTEEKPVREHRPDGSFGAKLI